jgi:hypothetical protein
LEIYVTGKNLIENGHVVVKIRPVDQKPSLNFRAL